MTTPDKIEASAETFLAYAKILAEMYGFLVSGGVPDASAVKLLIAMMQPQQTKAQPIILPDWKGATDA